MNGPMRVAVVAGVYPALSETFVSDHIDGLIDRGVDVRVVAERPDGTEFVGSAQLPSDLSERVTYRLARGDRDSATAKRVFELTRSLGRRAPTVAYRAATGASPGWSSRSALASYVEAVERIGPVDIIHCHFGPTGEMVARAGSLIGLETPIVTTFHGVDMTRNLRQFGVDAYSELLTSGRLFLPISEFFEGRLLELGAPPERVVVHRVGVDTTRLVPPATRETHAQLKALAVGRLVEKKGFADAIVAVSIARSRGCNVGLTIVGDGVLRSELEQLATSLDVREAVSFVGSQGRDFVREALLSSDVLLAPSVEARDGDMEGIPVVIMEALATGLPVISTWHSGIPELVVDGVSGLLASEHNPEGLATHLRRLEAAPELRQSLGMGGRRIVVDQHDVNTNLDQLMKLYELVSAA